MFAAIWNTHSKKRWWESKRKEYGTLKFKQIKSRENAHVVNVGSDLSKHMIETDRMSSNCIAREA